MIVELPADPSACLELTEPRIVSRSRATHAQVELDGAVLGLESMTCGEWEAEQQATEADHHRAPSPPPLPPKFVERQRPPKPSPPPAPPSPSPSPPPTDDASAAVAYAPDAASADGTASDAVAPWPPALLHEVEPSPPPPPPRPPRHQADAHSSSAGQGTTPPPPAISAPLCAAPAYTTRVFFLTTAPWTQPLAHTPPSCTPPLPTAPLAPLAPLNHTPRPPRH